MQILPTSKEQNKNIFFLLLTFIISLSLVLISFIGSTTYAAVPTVSLALPSTGTQEPVFDINVTFSEEVSGVDIADFRFVESSTDTEKGSIINVAEYDDVGFAQCYNRLLYNRHNSLNRTILQSYRCIRLWYLNQQIVIVLRFSKIVPLVSLLHQLLKNMPRALQVLLLLL